MSEAFMASNGIDVQWAGSLGCDQILRIGAHGRVSADLPEWQALREFFCAERDEELGRWRWPENPKWIVYAKRPGFSPVGNADLLVVNEVDGCAMEYITADDDGATYVGPDERAAKAARAYLDYLDARPESRPWEDAKPGEVWVLSFRDHESPWVAEGGDYRHLFRRGDQSITKVHMDITAGRRIWPEDAS